MISRGCMRNIIDIHAFWHKLQPHDVRIPMHFVVADRLLYFSSDLTGGYYSHIMGIYLGS
jgi:hypothetical protein